MVRQQAGLTTITQVHIHIHGYIHTKASLECSSCSILIRATLRHRETMEPWLNIIRERGKGKKGKEKRIKNGPSFCDYIIDTNIISY
jgi:hypothetical protein